MPEFAKVSTRVTNEVRSAFLAMLQISTSLMIQRPIDAAILHCNMRCAIHKHQRDLYTVAVTWWSLEDIYCN